MSQLTDEQVRDLAKAYANGVTPESYRICDLAADLLEARAERDKWQTLFCESEEENCSCNIVDTSKPVGHPYNYVCDWHQRHPHISLEREKVLTLAERAETAEQQLQECREALQSCMTVIEREYGPMEDYADSDEKDAWLKARAALTRPPAEKEHK